MNMTPSDRAALEIGRLFMRAHAAEQMVEQLAQQLAAEQAKPAPKQRQKRKTQ